MHFSRYVKGFRGVKHDQPTGACNLESENQHNTDHTHTHIMLLQHWMTLIHNSCHIKTQVYFTQLSSQLRKKTNNDMNAVNWMGGQS